MRFYEIKTIKPIKPLTPAQARVNALKQAKDALTAERDRQKQAKAAHAYKAKLKLEAMYGKANLVGGVILAR